MSVFFPKTGGWVLWALLWVSAVAAALPLPGTAPAARVDVSPPQQELQEKINAGLKSYAQSQPEQKADDDQRRRRAEMQIIKKLLRSEGYYEAQVKQREARRYEVVSGPRVTIRQWRIEPEQLGDEAWPTVKLQAGQPLLAQAVLTTRNRLLAFARQQCYPRAKVDYRVTIDAQTQTADLVFTAKPGSRNRIGAIEITGLENVDEAFLRNSMGLKTGQCLRRSELDQTRLMLLQTGLVSSVSYEIAWPASEESDMAASGIKASGIKEGSRKTLPVPVRFTITERKSRSLKASVGYTTDAREGITLGWEHRNLWGNAEKLEIEGGIDRISRSALARLTLPQFYHPRQELQLVADIDTEEPDAYTSRSRELAAILSREWRGGRRASIGVAFTDSRVEEGGDGDSFALLSLPVALSLDRRDNPIDANAGWYTNLALRPFTDISQDDLNFFQSVLSVRGYVSAADWFWQPTLALRASTGSMSGAALQDIPADQRFYVGGGGSVRGYPYQTVGELTDGEADGGKSFAETSVELRLHITDDWGLVLFADGGYAYPDELPEFGTDFLWGAGLGLRYFTRFAPIRIDIAAPLDRRDDVDSDFQLYISIGQAF